MSNTSNPVLDLIEELGNNIDTISYDTKTETWTISYKNGIPSDEVGVELFMDFIRKA